MAEYVCETCGMGVTGLNCVKCGKELEHDHLKCRICDDIVDIHVLSDGIRNKVQKQFKFEVDDVEMNIIGTCKKHK